ncbi:MAG: hypothetical protein KKA42_09080, partial [candidate division Zixibacteria bacterium]|nr:hypothetical protein [candidate division Zixibacteria bacterium]
LLGGGLTIIPTRDSSRLSSYAAINYSARRFRTTPAADDTSSVPGHVPAETGNPNESDADDWDGTLAVGYLVSQSMRLRVGTTYRSTSYANDEVEPKHTFDYFLGGNLSLPGRNALDIEAGYTQGNLERVPTWDYEFDLPRGQITPDSIYSILIEDDLNSWYISPRLSRPIGNRTGVSITYSHREFIDRNDSALVYGYSSGYLSPWVSSYEGDAVQIKVKTYLIPKMIVTSGFGYWDKSMLDMLEQYRDFRIIVDPFTGDTMTVDRTYNANPYRCGIQERSDQRRQVFVNLQMPLQLRQGLLEPSLKLEFTSNSSSVRVYDYTDFAITTGIRFRF